MEWNDAASRVFRRLRPHRADGRDGGAYGADEKYPNWKGQWITVRTFFGENIPHDIHHASEIEASTCRVVLVATLGRRFIRGGIASALTAKRATRAR